MVVRRKYHSSCLAPRLNYINNTKIQVKFYGSSLKEDKIYNIACCYIDIYFDNILLKERSYENILIYYVAYRTQYSAKPLLVIFDKVDGYIRKYVGTKYLTIFHSDHKI